MGPDAISITEFRKNTKVILDSALHDPVYLRRGDEVFKLSLEGKIGFISEKNNSIAAQPLVKASVPVTPKIREGFSEVHPFAKVTDNPDTFNELYPVATSSPVRPDFDDFRAEESDRVELAKEPADPVFDSDPALYDEPVMERTGDYIRNVEIAGLNAELANRDPFNQDPDYDALMSQKAIKIQELWAEWHQVTGR